MKTENLLDVTKLASPHLDTSDVLVLLAQLKNEKDRDRRAGIIRKIGQYYPESQATQISELQVIKTLLDLGNDVGSDDFFKYEIKLSLHKISDKIAAHSDVDIDFFLKNLAIFQSQENTYQAPKVLIDADLIEEFLLRNQTTLNREATRVMGLVLEGKINPYIGDMGLIRLHRIKV